MTTALTKDGDPMKRTIVSSALLATALIFGASAAPATATASEFQIPTYCAGSYGIKQETDSLFTYFPIVKANVFTQIAGTEKVAVVPCGIEWHQMMLVTNNSNGRWLKYQYLPDRLYHAHAISASADTVKVYATAPNRVHGAYGSYYTGKWNRVANKYDFNFTKPAIMAAADRLMLNEQMKRSAKGITLTTNEKAKFRAFFKGVGRDDFYGQCKSVTATKVHCEMQKGIDKPFFTFTLAKKGTGYDVSRVNTNGVSEWDL